MRHLLLISTILTASFTAFADTKDPATDFMSSRHESLSSLLQQPASQSRDAAISFTMEETLDFTTLVPSTFGHPCPTTQPACTDLWEEMTTQQRGEATTLLHEAVTKSYKRNLIKTLDYSVNWKESKQLQLHTRVRSEASNPIHPRDPAIRIDYIVSSTQKGLRVIDVVTEGSSLTKNYYDQFLKLWNQGGFPLISSRLKSKL